MTTKRFTLKALVKGRESTYIILVDEQDAYLLRTHAWGINCDDHGNKYVARHLKKAGIGSVETLSRRIMNAADGETVIYRNDDTLDCRRTNLRLLSKDESANYRNANRFGQAEIVKRMKETS